MWHVLNKKYFLNNQIDIIINGCKNNDIHCQEQLYKLCYPEMIKICLRYAIDLDGAGVIYNNAMLKIFNNIQKYREEGRFMGWVKKIVINSSIDFIKQNTKFKQESFQIIPEEVLIEDIESLNNLTVKEIRRMIAELPKATSAVFNLFAYEGFSHSQISGILDISEGTSKWHVNHAKSILKKRLQHFFTSEFKKNAAG